MATASTSRTAGPSGQQQQSREWPPSLKNFVANVFSRCTDSTKPAVEKELKAAIFKAYQDNTLWSMNWEAVKLQSLENQSSNLSASTSSQGKRKKNDVSRQGGMNMDEDMRNKRAKRFQDAQKLEQQRSKGKQLHPSMHIYGNRVQNASAYSHAATPEPEHNPDVIDWDKHTIVGTSAALEKPYLRLTSVPDPANVRPLPILRQTLELLKKKWRTENNYNYVCDQFKSLRQDLTVQRIKNDFTVSVYEIHARIALEKGDLGEYNQCQSQLRHLYSHGLKGHPEEFLAYRILYLLHTRNRRDINALLSGLTPQERLDESVQHALAVRGALATNNYHAFFKLFYSAPKMGAYMMDHFLPRERMTALNTMARAYMVLPLSFIAAELAFENTQEAHDFLEVHQAAVYQASSTNNSAGRQWDCKSVRDIMAAALMNYTKVDIKGQI